MRHERLIVSAGAHPVFRRLTEARLAWKLSRAKVAAKMGCSPKTLQKIETGLISPSLSLLISWADALGYEITLWPRKQ